MTPEGLKAVKVLKKEGIKTNVTLIFSPNQALLAARAGAAYVSPFLKIRRYLSYRQGVDLDSYDRRYLPDQWHYVHKKRSSVQVSESNYIVDLALAGADIATVPYNVLLYDKTSIDRSGIENSKQITKQYLGNKESGGMRYYQ